MKISGTAKVGSVLTATAGDWPKGNRDTSQLVFAWERNGVHIEGTCEKSSYKLTAADKGKKITVRTYKVHPFAPVAASIISNPVIVR